jgi:hypothetical protein
MWIPHTYSVPSLDSRPYPRQILFHRHYLLPTQMTAPFLQYLIFNVKASNARSRVGLDRSRNHYWAAIASVHVRYHWDRRIQICNHGSMVDHIPLRSQTQVCGAEF